MQSNQSEFRNKSMANSFIDIYAKEGINGLYRVCSNFFKMNNSIKSNWHQLKTELKLAYLVIENLLKPR